MSDHHLLYVIGEPGSGKTTLVNALTAGLQAVPMSQGLMRYYVLQTEPRVFELGVRRDSFSGTDALAMNVQPEAQSWFELNAGKNYVIAEGDRLANMKFFRAVLDAGWYLHVAYLMASPLTLARRRQDRAFLLSVKPQSETWLKGRTTKVNKLLASLPAHCVKYYRHDDGATADVVSQLVHDNPVAQVLQRGGGA